MDKLRQVFSWIYFIMYLSLVWFISLALGLLFFSFVPACVTAVEQVQMMRKDQLRGQLALGSRYFSSFFNHLKDFYLTSLVFLGLLFILLTNYLFLSGTRGLITYLLFYLTIAMIIAWFWIVATFCVVGLNYPDLSTKDQVKNSSFIVLSHLLEYLIVGVLHIASAMVLWAISPILIAFVPVLGLIFYDYLICKILKGFSIRSYFKNFINSHE